MAVLLLRSCKAYNFQLRNILAMLCLAISICTYMQILALEAGIAARFARILADSGTNTLTINAGTFSVLPSRGGGEAPATTLKPKDLTMLVRENAQLRGAAPVVTTMRLLEFRELSMVGSVTGTTAAYQRLMQFYVRQGRFIDEFDNSGLRKVAVIGSTVAERLFGTAQERVLDTGEVVGSTIRIGNVPFEVVGVLQAKGSSQAGMDQDNIVIVPFATANRKLLNRDFLDSIVLEVDPEADRSELARALSKQLRLSHGLDGDKDNDFVLLDAMAGLEALDFSTEFSRRLFRWFAALTGMIALVGIIGVNWLNVRERQGEIGLRKAVGALRRDIMAMIVAENLAGGVLAGLAGLLLGAGMFFLLGLLTQWPLAIDPAVLGKPFAVALSLSCLAALVPAWRAARLPPVEALNRN